MSARRVPWAGAGLLFVAYYATAKAGLLLEPVGGFATLVWPPAGIALAALVRWGWGLWPGAALGAFLANWTSGAPALGAAGVALGNTAEALAAAAILRRADFRPSLERVRDAGALLLAAGLTAPLSATTGVASLSWAGVLPPDEAAVAWRAWVLGNVLGALTAAPAVLTWGAPARRRSDWRPATEEALFILGLAAINGFVFLPPGGDGPLPFLSAYLLIVPLFWAALRLDPSGVALAILATSAFAVWGTASGGGPFGKGPLLERLFLLQAFMGFKAVASLLLAAAVAERRRTFRDLQLSEQRLTGSHEGLRQVNRWLAASLQEKETLLREVHHRVKNNLQTVHSLLSLHAKRVKDPGAAAGLKDCRERVMSMALVHEMLYRSRDLARVDFSEYLRELGRRLTQSVVARPDGRRVALEVEAEPATLDVQEAVPCGLAVHELVTNALKHAFPGDRGGTIRVRLARRADDLVLTVSDDGVGVPEGLDPAKVPSMGLVLVANLVGQLGGAFRVERDGGTVARISFPWPGPEAASGAAARATLSPAQPELAPAVSLKAPTGSP